MILMRRRFRTLSDIIIDPEIRTKFHEFNRTQKESLDLRLYDNIIESTGKVKESTLWLISLCDKGVTVSELLRIPEFRIFFRQDEGKVPSRRCLTMRLLRYCRQGYLKRSANGEKKHYITWKGNMYEPKVPLTKKVEQIFRLLRKDPRYAMLISDPFKDKLLESIFIEHTIASVESDYL